MTEFAGIFEVLAADQSDARLASRKALVLSRDRIDARLGKFLAASRSPEEFDARFELVKDDFAGIVRVAADEIGHDDPDSLVQTLHDHYRTAGKPPWLKDDDDDDDDSEPGEDKDKGDDKDDKKAPPFGKKDSTVADYLSGHYATKDDDDHEEDEDAADRADREAKEDDSKHLEEDSGYSSSVRTADAVPLVAKIAASYQCECEHCGHRWKSDEQNPETCPRCGSLGEHETDPDAESKESSVRIADEGNTGLGGPSPTMDKARWTPKSVKPIDVPSERHPTIQKDIMEVMPKKNLTGPAHDMDEINSVTTVETLPSEKENSGFQTGGEDFGPHTKTFGDGGQTDPVKSESLEA